MKQTARNINRNDFIFSPFLSQRRANSTSPILNISWICQAFEIYQIAMPAQNITEFWLHIRNAGWNHWQDFGSAAASLTAFIVFLG
jgi:hypothetical protein